jgi:hypothetical protein
MSHPGTTAQFETGFVGNRNQRTRATSGDASLYYGTPEYSAYVNDSWNATRKLNVIWACITTCLSPHIPLTTTGDCLTRPIQDGNLLCRG